MSQKTWLLTGVALILGGLSGGCQSGGVGDPCTPEDEFQTGFSGYAFTEVNIESKSFQCETRLCLVNHFQGRVSCPYGQTAMQAADMTRSGATEYQLCHVPGTTGISNRIKVAVDHQLTDRRPLDSVYCSCRCDGPDPNARYCKCPTGFQCTQLLTPNSRLGAAELSGSYCVKNGTEFIQGETNTSQVCQPTLDSPTSPRLPPDSAGDCGAYDGE
jgi:hypothetical protein